MYFNRYISESVFKIINTATQSLEDLECKLDEDEPEEDEDLEILLLSYLLCEEELLLYRRFFSLLGSAFLGFLWSELDERLRLRLLFDFLSILASGFLISF